MANVIYMKLNYYLCIVNEIDIRTDKLKNKIKK